MPLLTLHLFLADECAPPEDIPGQIDFNLVRSPNLRKLRGEIDVLRLASMRPVAYKIDNPIVVRCQRPTDRPWLGPPFLTCF